MSFPIMDNMQLNAPIPIDPRFKFETYKDMIEFPKIYLYDGIFAFCAGKDDLTKRGYYSGKLNTETNEIEFSIFNSGNGAVVLEPDEVKVFYKSMEAYQAAVDSGDINEDNHNVYIVYDSDPGVTEEELLSREFIFEQTELNTLWNIAHNLGTKYPNMIVLNNNDEEIIGEVINRTSTSLQIKFDIPINGKVVLRR